MISFFSGMRIRNFFPRIRIRIRPEIEMKKKLFLYFRQVGIKFDIITHHFMLEFVDSDVYFIQDKNNFINSLLQVGSGGPKITGSGSGGPKITGSDRIRIRILIPDTRDRLITYKNSEIFKKLHLQYKLENKMTKRKHPQNIQI